MASDYKTLVIPTKHNWWFGTDYNMNLYRGCSHGCIYCDSRSQCYQIDDFTQVQAKGNTTEMLRQQLQKKKHTGVIATGSMSDPYNPLEAQLQLTRQALEQIDAQGFGVAIATKSDLILRDRDILARIAKHSPVLCKITITANDDGLGRLIEPNVAPTSRRFEVVQALRDSGIYAGILLMPILPFITDSQENIGGIIARAKVSDAQFIYPMFGVTLRDRQRQYFYDQLARYFPGVKQRYLQQFGNQYRCDCPEWSSLWSWFENQCEAQGILCHMKQIIQGYKGGYFAKQLSLF